MAVLFRIPDRTRGTWKRVLSRDDLDPDEPRVVAVRDNTLILRSSK
ncbi:type VI secretion protein [Yersinia pseudotuberculosis]|uniref:Type VI secretion protein n=1 Tax=Yersinia pseudotuberculosis TaxID=633 RepID=A0ABN5RBY5_YERPU|nr:type VI secretion protein [Yersinia pseudotuberculosis]AYW94090.1 type VI secretion protein [Yersinia pseudotuberculosis]AYW98172.1 type VI secretion protein [Yersinia pseudotuberculosis]AYX02327.1 type VI secretion protein [Yersinia pseudotuberculosis]AZA32529.1 type VI secretion protein [Yersinia pseudotuberculosis]